MKKIFKQIAFCSIGISLFFVFGTQALADANTANFETFTLGSVNGQSGWTSGQGNSSCPNFDVAVVPNTYGYSSFQTQSLRISNGITCGGNFAGQLRSPILADEAGETSAASSTSPLGTRQPYFQAQWDFASAQPGSEQSGLSVVGSPDSGNGSRMSWLGMQDTPSGLELDFYDYEDSASGLVFTPIATGLDRTIPHTVKITMNFIDGPSNDVVNIYLDGLLIHTGTTWEGYDRSVGSEPSAIDSVMFRVSGTAVPANIGKGFLIDNFSSESGPVPVPVSSANLHIIDNNQTSATSSIFNVHVEQNGTDVTGSPAIGTTTPGTLYSLSPGTYLVSEDANASSTQTFSGDCDSTGSVTLSASDDKTCTITDTDISTSTPIVPVPAPVVSPIPAGGGGSGNSYSSGGGGNGGGANQNTTVSNQIVIPNSQNITTTVTTTVVTPPVQVPDVSIMSAVFNNYLSQGNVFNVSFDVSRLQTLLASNPLIYPEGLVTGYFGPFTLNAVENFQLQNNIASTTEAGFGTVGPLTRAALLKVFGE